MVIQSRRGKEASQVAAMVVCGAGRPHESLVRGTTPFGRHDALEAGKDRSDASRDECNELIRRC